MGGDRNSAGAGRGRGPGHWGGSTTREPGDHRVQFHASRGGAGEGGPIAGSGLRLWLVVRAWLVAAIRLSFCRAPALFPSGLGLRRFFRRRRLEFRLDARIGRLRLGSNRLAGAEKLFRGLWRLLFGRFTGVNQWVWSDRFRSAGKLVFELGSRGRAASAVPARSGPRGRTLTLPHAEFLFPFIPHFVRSAASSRHSCFSRSISCAWR